MEILKHLKKYGFPRIRDIQKNRELQGKVEESTFDIPKLENKNGKQSCDASIWSSLRSNSTGVPSKDESSSPVRNHQYSSTPTY